MGYRGPLREPGSRRDIAQRKKDAQFAAMDGAKNAGADPLPENREPVVAGRPTKPSGIPGRVAELFEGLVDDMIAAGLPPLQVDSWSIVQAARCIYSTEAAEGLAHEEGAPSSVRLGALTLYLRAVDQSQKWLKELGATPVSRMRMGIKPPQEKKKSALEEMLEKRNG